jgi:hypothetical protein
VPEEAKKVFGIITDISSGVSKAARKPKDPPPGLPKGSERKGDAGNPTDRSIPTKTSDGSGNKAPKCRVALSSSTKRSGNKLTEQSCVGEKTVATVWRIRSVTYDVNATPTLVSKPCRDDWPQACYHTALP